MDDVREIDIDEAKKRLDQKDALFVDVRDPHSHEAAHIKGAYHFADQESADKFIDETDKGSTVIVYCYHGNSSMGAAAFLMERGFQDVYSMSGGFEGWRMVHEFESRSS